MRGAAALLAVLALAAPAIADAPVTVLGSQLRLSAAGADGDKTVDAIAPAIAYNPERNEYLLAYETTDSSAATVTVIAQRLDANGTAIGGPATLESQPSRVTFQSELGVAYDSADDQYAVVY